MKKRTKIIILTLMVLLLGVTGYLNITLNNTLKQTSTTVTTTSFFTSYRNDRENTRDQELLYYDAIIESPSSSADAVKAAENAKMALIANMEKELSVEGMIKAQGFADCVISMAGEKVNVVVKSAMLTENEVAQIATIVKDQLGVKIRNIVIFSAE